jgi:hypothetical protein
MALNEYFECTDRGVPLPHNRNNVYLCKVCGAVVGDPQTHAAWHNTQEETS